MYKAVFHYFFALYLFLVTPYAFADKPPKDPPPLEPLPIACSTNYANNLRVNEFNVAGSDSSSNSGDGYIELYTTQAITLNNKTISYYNSGKLEPAVALASSSATVYLADGSYQPANNYANTAVPTNSFIVYPESLFGSTTTTAFTKGSGEILIADSSDTVIHYVNYSNNSSQSQWDVATETPSCKINFDPDNASENGLCSKPDGGTNWQACGATKGTSNDENNGGGNTDPSEFNAFDTETTPNTSTDGYLKTRIKDNNPIQFDVISLNNSVFNSSFSGEVKVELLANNSSNATNSSDHCLNNYSIISTKNGSIADGRSSFNLPAVDNVWRYVGVRISYPSSSPTITICSTDLFAIRPSAFTLEASHQDWETAGNTEPLDASTSSVISPLHKAGRYFRLKIIAVDSAGDTTSNYDETPISSIQLVEPSPGTLGSFNLGTLSKSNGVITSDTASYLEVGIISLQFTDTYFANTDLDDGSSLSDRTIESPVITVGRFTPDHFELSIDSHGSFGVDLSKDPITEASCYQPSFFYSGQEFSYLTAPSIIATAYNYNTDPASDSITKNYTGSFSSLTATDFNVTAPTTDSSQPGADLSNKVNLNWSSGTATLTDNNNGSHTFIFGNDQYTYIHEANSKISLFSSDIALIFTDITDSDDVSASTDLPLTLTPTATEIRFGRLNIENAFGSELTPLPIPFYTEYFNGSSFITNTADACTTATVSQLSFNSGSNPITVGSGTSTASITHSPLVSGVAGLTLSAPGADNTGDVDITSTNFISSFPWLAYDWDGDSSYDNSPTARATFGIYKGNSKQIYFREVY